MSRSLSRCQDFGFLLHNVDSLQFFKTIKAATRRPETAYGSSNRAGMHADNAAARRVPAAPSSGLLGLPPECSTV